MALLAALTGWSLLSAVIKILSFGAVWIADVAALIQGRQKLAMTAEQLGATMEHHLPLCFFITFYLFAAVC